MSGDRNIASENNQSTVNAQSTMNAQSALNAQSTWAVHFPGNLRWSNAMQIVKGMAPYGAIAMEEVDRIGDRLKARDQERDPDIAWKEEWSAMAERVAKVADTAAAEGRNITAGHHYMRAATTITAPSASSRRATR